MLIISRGINESVVLVLPSGEKITITKLEKGRIGIDAPKEVDIVRAEFLENQSSINRGNK
jgi:carbon storage regulator CsrA